MKANKIRFEDFKDEKLTKNQLKTVQGGDIPDDIIDPKDPNKGGTGHGGTP